ncbi:hypothetical protein AB6E39_07345, partial [Vibrio splendidus]|nr:hypothetical protein [Vibrio splendidus]
MRYLIFLSCFLSPFVFADDALVNPVAQKIKATVLKGLNKSNIDFDGYCDLMRLCCVIQFRDRAAPFRVFL